MKRLFVLMILAALALTNVSAQQPAVELSFTFTRQSGSASNQYAAWIEDSHGQYVQTLYVTRWAANGGWRRRPAAIPTWVRQSGLSDKTRAQINAVSGGTPRTGALTYTWDGTNSRGELVPAGNYVLFLEGNLRWENRALYRVPIRLGQGAAAAQVYVTYTGDPIIERSMIDDVRVRVLR
jgi:hypothetical protein